MAENDDFLDGLWARVVTKCYWNYCKQHLEQLLSKFEKAVGLFFMTLLLKLMIFYAYSRFLMFQRSLF